MNPTGHINILYVIIGYLIKFILYLIRVFNFIICSGGDNMTYKKIAELAHVSVSTVSKVLSGSSEISDELSEKIRRIAMEGGYFKEKNKRKREYSNNRALLIAVVVPEIVSVNYSAIVTCLKKAIESRGGRIAVYMYDFDMKKLNSTVEMIIIKENADGIILFSSPSLSVKPNIPIVCIGGISSERYDSVGVSVEAIMNDAVEFLKNLGHTKIGFVGETNTFTKHKAFKNAIDNSKLTYFDKYSYIIRGRFEEIGIEAAKKMISDKDMPTAVICAYDEVALGMIYELDKNGVSVPDDISVMGINNIPSSEYVKIPLTTVVAMNEEQYISAVEILFDKIINETSSVKHITMDHKIIERKSTRRI